MCIVLIILEFYMKMWRKNYRLKKEENSRGGFSLGILFLFLEYKRLQSDLFEIFIPQKTLNKQI